MARQQGCSCLPFALGALLLVAWVMQDQAVPPLQVEQFDPRSPRRPNRTHAVAGAPLRSPR